WEAASGRRRLRLPVERWWGPRALAVSPDTKTLAVLARRITFEAPLRLHLCDIATGKELHALDLGKQRPYATPLLSFSPDGGLLAAGIGDVQLVHVATGMPRARIPLPKQGAKALAFAPDGRTLVTAGDDETIRFSDVSTGKELAAFPKIT